MVIEMIETVSTLLGAINDGASIAQGLPGFFSFFRKNSQDNLPSLHRKFEEIQHYQQKLNKNQEYLNERILLVLSRKPYFDNPAIVQQTPLIINISVAPERYGITHIDYWGALFKSPIYRPDSYCSPVILPSETGKRVLVGMAPNAMLAGLFTYPNSYSTGKTQIPSKGFIQLSKQDQKYFTELYNKYVDINHWLRITIGYKDLETFIFELYRERHLLMLERGLNAVFFDIVVKTDRFNRRQATWEVTESLTY